MATELDKWIEVLDSGKVTHVRPRKWCGQWALYAYNRHQEIPYLYSVADSEEAYKAVLDRNISIEDLLH